MLENWNNHIEEFFRKASDEEANMPFIESDWEKMELLLEKEKPQPKTILFTRTLAAFVGLAIVGLILSNAYLFYRLKKAESEIQNNGKLVDKTLKSIVPTNIQKDAIISKKAPEVEETLKRNTIILEPQFAQTEEQNQKLHKNLSQNSNLPFEDEMELNFNGTKRNNRINFPDSISKITSEIPLQDSEAQNYASTEKHNHLTSSIITKDTFPKLASLANCTIVVHQPLLTQKIDSGAANNTIIESVTKKRLTAPNAKLKLYLSAGYSVTKAGNHAGKKLGNEKGISLFYSIIPKVAIGLGAIHNEKNYFMTGEECKISPNFWNRYTNNILPSWVYYKSSITDIPLKFQFLAMETKKAQLHLQADISNIFVSNNYYDFEFKNPNSGAKQNWNSNKNLFLPLAGFRLSTMLEYKVSPKITIGTQPYLYQAFKSFGWTNYNLTSIGINATVGYILSK